MLDPGLRQTARCCKMGQLQHISCGIDRDMILMAYAMNGVAQGVCDLWVLENDRRNGFFLFFFDATFGKFLKEKFPVILVFAQEPAVDVEWTEPEEMEIKEGRLRIKEEYWESRGNWKRLRSRKWV